MIDERDDQQTEEQQQPDEAAQDDGPDVSELDNEPDYNPDNELKDLKGG